MRMSESVYLRLRNPLYAHSCASIRAYITHLFVQGARQLPSVERERQGHARLVTVVDDGGDEAGQTGTHRKKGASDRDR